MTTEIERRVRTVEEELNGERLVSRYALEQVGRNSEVLHSVGAELATLRAELATLRADFRGATARIDVLGGQMTVAHAALTRHGRALDVLMQDVREIRTEQQAMRTEQQSMRTEQQSMRAEQHAMRAELNQKLEMLIARGPSAV